MEFAVVVMPPSVTRGEPVRTKHLIGGSVAGAVAPGFALSVDVSDVSLLHDGLDAAAGLEGGVEDATGTDAIGLSGILADDAGIGSAVN